MLLFLKASLSDRGREEGDRAQNSPHPNPSQQLVHKRTSPSPAAPARVVQPGGRWRREHLRWQEEKAPLILLVLSAWLELQAVPEQPVLASESSSKHKSSSISSEQQLGKQF